MDNTDQNQKIVDSIITLLAKESCSIEQAENILRYVGAQIRRLSVVRETSL